MLNNTKTDSCIIEAPEILLLIIGSLAAPLNGLILVMFNERKKFFRTRVSYLEANLSFADCFTGVVLVFIIVHQMTRWERLPEDLGFLLVSVSIQTSFLTLIHVSTDRLVVAMFPLTWSTILNVRRTTIAISVVWLASIFVEIMQRYCINKRRIALLYFFGNHCNPLHIRPCFHLPVFEKTAKTLVSLRRFSRDFSGGRPTTIRTTR